MRKGEIRPDLYKARIGICLICGKEFRAVKDFKERKQKYCSKECWSIRATIINKCKYCGKTKETKRIRTSSQYKEWRLKVFARDNFKCQLCGNTGRNLEAHHIKEVCNNPNLIFDVDNGVTLCHECHKLTDNYGYKARWNKD